MPKEELVLKLKKVISENEGDTEAIHRKMDYLLLEYIDDKEVSDTYDSVDLNYA